MQHVLDFDWAVFQFVEKYLWGPFLDILMPFITRLGDGGIIWIVLAVLLLFFKKYRKFGIMMVAALLLSLLINDNILKPLINRPRPFNPEAWKTLERAFIYPELVPRPHGLSFPSGHTSSSFAAAVVLIFTGKKRIYIPPLILAFLIAFSRIYVHVHYCTDVLAGMVVGTLYGLLAYLLIAKLLPLIQEKIRVKREKETF
ncbi:MAG: phosphatase PAP2 family protein [Clostridiales bacterium]|nr:phosphatase PAP2 family protein [Clostridiales bacterium]